MTPKEERTSEEEIKSRKQRKPKPKFDPVSGKWVVRNWDGTIAGIENGHLRSFDDIGKKMTEPDVHNMTNNGDSGSTMDDEMIQSLTIEEELIPYATIVSVADQSPAHEAGLKKDDKIVKFGTIDHFNNRNLRALGEVVSNAHVDGTGVAVVLRRTSAEGLERKLTLRLKPRTWSGNGLVGCVFSPVD